MYFHYSIHSMDFVASLLCYSVPPLMLYCVWALNDFSALATFYSFFHSGIWILCALYSIFSSKWASDWVRGNDGIVCSICVFRFQFCFCFACCDMEIMWFSFLFSLNRARRTIGNAEKEKWIRLFKYRVKWLPNETRKWRKKMKTILTLRFLCFSIFLRIPINSIAMLLVFRLWDFLISDLILSFYLSCARASRSKNKKKQLWHTFHIMMVQQQSTIGYLLSLFFVTILGMILNAVNILVSLLASRHRTCKWLFIRCSITRRARMSVIEWERS